MQRSQATPSNGQPWEAVRDPFFAIANEPLALLDNHGRVVRVNAAFTRLFGYAGDEISGIAFLEWVHPEERKATVAALGAAVAQQQTSTFQARVREQPGEYHPMAWTVTGSRGTLFLAGQELPTAQTNPLSPAELQAVLDAAPDLICVCDADGSMLYLNRAGRQWLGLQPGDELGPARLSDFAAGTGQERVFQEAFAAATEHGQWQGETVLRAADGAKTPALLLLTAHQDDERRTQRYSAVARDVSDRRRVEQALSRQAADLKTVAAISMATAQLLDVDHLLQELVDVTRERFDLYHAHVYLLNAAGDALELVAGAGDVGREMVAHGRRLALDQETSLVVRAARTRQGVTANDARREEGFLPHPLLPQTRSEMAVPMIVGERLVGVLDVQDDAAGRFDEVDAHIFTTLAAQAAVAVENARSFTRAQEAIAESSALMRLITREGWEGYVQQETETRGYYFDAERISPVLPHEGGAALSPTMEEAAVVQPLQVHDEVIGQLAFFTDESPFDEDSGELVAAIAAQLSARLENLRLTSATQLALSETASLYRAGSDLNRANTYVDVLDVLRRHTVAGRDASASALVLFDQPWAAGQKPGRFAVAAYHADFELPAQTMQRLAPPLFGLAGEIMQPDSPTFVADIEQASGLPAEVRHFFAAELQGKSAVFVPLTLGGQWIGYLTSFYREQMTLGDADLQHLTTLAGQAAAAVQSIFLLQSAEERARQERVLRELAARVRNVTDIDLIMKTAVREIGQVLGRETFLYLGDDQTVTASATQGKTGLETS